MTLEVCANPVGHLPRPHQIHTHHIVPKSWGGSDDPANLVQLCPNCHTSIHHLLNGWIRAGALTEPGTVLSRRYSGYVVALALRAWLKRPPKPPYTVA